MTCVATATRASRRATRARLSSMPIVCVDRRLALLASCCFFQSLEWLGDTTLVFDYSALSDADALSLLERIFGDRAWALPKDGGHIVLMLPRASRRMITYDVLTETIAMPCAPRFLNRRSRKKA